MKIKIEQMKCFDEVAKVIGAEKARRELFKVVEKFEPNIYYKTNYDYETLMGLPLLDAFCWDVSPQGHDFWEAIECGENPYEE